MALQTPAGGSGGGGGGGGGGSGGGSSNTGDSECSDLKIAQGTMVVGVLVGVVSMKHFLLLHVCVCVCVCVYMYLSSFTNMILKHPLIPTQTRQVASACCVGLLLQVWCLCVFLT